MPDMATLTLEEARSFNADVFELKIDGSRMSYTNGVLFSDRLINRNARYPHILKEVSKIDWEVRGEMAIPDGNVHQLNKKENWHKARYYIFDIFKYQGKDCSGMTAAERRELIDKLLVDSFLHVDALDAPQQFLTFQAGWDFAVATNAEGIVSKTKNGTCYKTKLLKEEKLKIVGHVAGKAKGAFLIERNGVVGKVSGTSVDFLSVYQTLMRHGKEVFAEIEYAFITDKGIPFQPRLRRVGTLDDLKFT